MSPDTDPSSTETDETPKKHGKKRHVLEIELVSAAVILGLIGGFFAIRHFFFKKAS